MINCGIEIEFISNNYNSLFSELLEQTNVIIIGDPKYTSSTALIIKPELSVKGFEINIPPTFTEGDLIVLCSIAEKYVLFNERCSMHIHVPINNPSDLNKIDAYYAAHEQEILNAADQMGLYLNLNKSVVNNTIITNANINTKFAYQKHGTAEHRIYKATFDYQNILWAINQTKGIINEALA